MKYIYDYMHISGNFFPIIPFQIGKGDSWIPVSALIDSGAFMCLFNAGVAEALGIEVEKGEPFTLTGIGGSVLSYIHDVILRIEDFDIKTKVAFTRHMAVSVNLIGRKGFFDAFSVLFNDRERTITLEKFEI